jgi:hypothetical protein
VQTTVDVRADTSAGDAERFDSLVELARSLEHCLEVGVVDRHGARNRVPAIRETQTTPDWVVSGLGWS